MCAWTIWYEESRIDHLPLLLVVTMLYACWLSWRAYYIEDIFIFNLGLQLKGCFERGVFWRTQIVVEGHRRLSILNNGYTDTTMTTKRVFSVTSSIFFKWHFLSSHVWSWMIETWMRFMPAIETKFWYTMHPNVMKYWRKSLIARPHLLVPSHQRTVTTNKGCN